MPTKMYWNSNTTSSLLRLPRVMSVLGAQGYLVATERHVRRILKSRVIMTRIIIAVLSVASLSLGIASRIIPHQGTKAAASQPAPVATYTLITGDRILVTRTSSGTPSVSVVPDGGSGGGGGGGGVGDGCGAPRGLQTFASGQHLYVIPDDAAGYIGAPLSIDLFDVNAMTPDTTTTTTTAPLSLSVAYTSGSAQQLPKGLSKAADGSVTVTNRKQFGAALAQSWQITASGGTPQLFDGIARIAPAGATAASAAPTPPPGKLFTVTVKAFDRSGRPALDALADLENEDNFLTYFGLQGFYYHGTAAFSVPAGHYSLNTGMHTHYPDTSYDATFEITPELDVTGDMTIVVEARKAQLVSAATPLPATPHFQGIDYERVDAQGFLATVGISEVCGVPLYTTPTAPVSVGRARFSVQDYLVNSQGDPAGYLYDLDFPYGAALPSTLAETVTASQLATLDSRFHSPVLGRREAVMLWPTSPEVGSAGAILTYLIAPGERTQQYVTAQPNVFWQQGILAEPESFTGVMYGTYASYTPGQQVQDDWMAQPLASGIVQDRSQIPGIVNECPMCRSGDTLTTVLSPFTDQHAWMFPDYTTTENLTLYQNGTQVGQLPYGYLASFAMSPDPATYKLVYDVTKNDPLLPTSTSVHTEWTFASQERAPDHLPPGWVCGNAFLGTTTSTNCNFEPLLFASYSTPGAGLDNVIPMAGPATVDVSLSHQRGMAASPISHFSAQVSYDDGQTWQSAPATDQGNGVYRLQYTQPALEKTNGFATLRIQATDSAGSAIDQTVTRAYPLTSTPLAQLPTTANKGTQPACATASAAPYAQCMALVNTDAGISASQPHGLSPADIQAAYNLPSTTAGQGRTVAIVDAFDDPNAETDLATYRAHYGLSACTSANGCFTKVNERGEKANYPYPDPGWSLEISLDLDAVSATCPNCQILLVEADDPSMVGLVTAVQTAQRLGANVISNSYGTGGEFSGEQDVERAYRDLKVPFVVSSGDYGYGNSFNLFGETGPAFPAVSQYAIAVGGTSLTRSTTPRGWSESAWGEVFGDLHWGATSGCSAYIHKPGWQKDTLCSMRTVADVSAVADPATGLAVYDTFYFDGWLQVGGTSLSAPIISAVFALAGDGSTVRYASNLYNYAGTTDLNDVVGGSNATSAQCVNASYLCTAVPGYDGPTGLGTPNGTNAFH